ncbi:predicted protein [Naegleria gruberi]|uniref:Predicted protein n=1 Tax=Naegleria gruberi TaxID=5762 RepID=D2VD07_NAEGR|nr:uncharacterized protein NAEGRDRAFT_66754 [Naegleria gruberi]EFC45399.1 predicted protein [Naegleria gruberi]|eukprot:XP_002678143.1 predicted protein [Naegleria gruberi strain NEG-M]
MSQLASSNNVAGGGTEKKAIKKPLKKASTKSSSQSLEIKKKTSTRKSKAASTTSNNDHDGFLDTTATTTTSNVVKKPGTWWFWYYKQALATGSEIPKFTIQGRKSLLGLILGNRNQLSSDELTKSHCLIFFPKADHSTDQFTTSLLQSFKSSVVLSKQQKNIHIFITCPSLETFDLNTKNVPSGINIWADLNGEIANLFGMRPLIQDINLDDLLSDEKKKNTYSKQTIIGMFFTLDKKIVKSPAFQPKLQTVTLDIIKSIYDFMDKSQYNFAKITNKDSLASDLSENDLKTLHAAAYNDYQRELKQMESDLNPSKKSTSSSTNKKKTTTSKTKSINKNTPTKEPPQRYSKL